jgi:eukaryotic-like serine/threonine-protein kinase
MTHSHMTLTKTHLFGMTPEPSTVPEAAEPTVSYEDRARSPVAPGDRVAGKYEVERVLAGGGMGIVVGGGHVELDERVAIKFLREDSIGDPEAVARFEREGRTAIKIKSEHAMKVIDVGSLENGTPYIVMEHLEGEDLASWLRTRGALRLSTAVEFMLQICDAMSEAHALGFVHRDLKPSNLFVTRRANGRMAIKVLDFGISKLTTDTSLTRRNVAIGSPCYMSPEQITCAVEIDRRADIWALGVTMFEMLTGTVPFDGDTTPQLCNKVLQDPAPLVRDLRPNVPEGLERIIARCLEKQREKRFENVSDLAAALAPFASPPGFDSTRVVWDQESQAFPRPQRVRPAVMVFTVMGMAIFVIFLAWRKSMLRAAQLADLPAAEPVPAAPAPPLPSEVPAPPPEPEPTPAREPSLSPRVLKSPSRATTAPKRPAAAATVSAPSSTPTPKGANVFDERN